MNKSWFGFPEIRGLKQRQRMMRHSFHAWVERQRPGIHTVRCGGGRHGTAFTEYSFQAEASQASTELELGFRDDVGYFSLDDVSVTAVPEPAVGVLGGMFLLAGLGFRLPQQLRRWRP